MAARAFAIRQQMAILAPACRPERPLADGWRGGRVAEGDGLLNRYTGYTGIEGSNPSPSATAA